MDTIGYRMDIFETILSIFVIGYNWIQNGYIKKNSFQP
ncbi:hypothetical protein FORMB_18360 [Formosa sp. Hel1_33_131]|nr:hypothetical protein FORMB_18360 [Formosa sp. Hel1_33_131]